MVMMATVLGIMDRVRVVLNQDVVWIWEKLREVWSKDSRGGNMWQGEDRGERGMDNDQEWESDFVDSLEL